MRIYFSRSGGFAGMRLSATLDTATLPAEEADDLRRMVDESGFFDLPSTVKSSPQADQFHYQVTVETDGRRHSVEFDEAAVPEALRPLLQRLTQVARSAGRP